MFQDLAPPVTTSDMIVFGLQHVVLARWQMSYPEGGQFYIFRGLICTSQSLEHGQQASLLMTCAEVALLWGAFVLVAAISPCGSWSQHVDVQSGAWSLWCGAFGPGTRQQPGCPEGICTAACASALEKEQLSIMSARGVIVMHFLCGNFAICPNMGVYPRMAICCNLAWLKMTAVQIMAFLKVFVALIRLEDLMTKSNWLNEVENMQRGPSLGAVTQPNTHVKEPTQGSGHRDA